MKTFGRHVSFFVVFVCQLGLSASVTTTALNFRTGPGTDFPIIRTIEPGRTVEILNKIDLDNDWRTPDWSQILYGEEIGYVSNEFLSLKKEPIYGLEWTSKNNYYPGETRLPIKSENSVYSQTILVRVFPVVADYFIRLRHQDLKFSSPPTRFTRDYVAHPKIPSDRIYEFGPEPMTNFIELPELEAGGYIVTLSRPETPNAIEAHAQILVTRLAVFSKSDGNSSIAWVVDSKTGAPLPGASIEWLDEDRSGNLEKIASSRTNPSGIATATTPDNANRTFRATLGQDMAFIRDARGGGVNRSWPTGANPASVGKREDQRVLLITDRPLYRGGDTVKIEGSALDLVGPQFKPSAKTLILKLAPSSDSKNIIEEFEVTPDQGGRLKFEFKLDPDLRDALTLSAFDKASGRPAGSTNFAARPYVKPVFSATLSGPAEVVSGTHTFQILGNYFSGGRLNALANIYLVGGYPISNNYDSEFQGRQYFDESPFLQSLPADAYSWDQGLTDRQGQEKSAKIVNGSAKIALELNAKKSEPAYFRIESRIRDEFGREIEVGHSVVVYPSSVALEAKSSKTTTNINQPIRVTLSARKVGTAQIWAGQSLAGKIYRRVWEYENNRWEVKERQIEKFKIQTDKKGIASLTYNPQGTGTIWIEVESSDKEKRKSTLTQWMGWVPETDFAAEEARPEMPFIKIKTASRVHKVGEEMGLKIDTNLPDEASIWFTLEGRKIFSNSVTTVGALRNLKIKILADFVPGFNMSAIGVQDGLDAYADSSTQFVPPEGKKVEVKLDAKHAVNKPGGQLEVTVKTTKDGKPVSTWVLLGAVNEIIYALQAKTTPDPYLYFWGYGGNKVSSYDSITQSVCECGGGGGEPGSAGSFREDFSDTALFQSVKTDKNGVGTIKVKIPDDLAKYQLEAYAVGSDAAAGFAKAKFEARLPFYVRLSLPEFLTKGDKSTGYATIHNLSSKPQTTTLVINSGGVFTKKIIVPAQNSTEVPFKFDAEKVGKLSISATAKSELFSDSIRTSIPVREVGNEVEMVWFGESAGGSLVDQIEIPKGVVSAKLSTVVSGSSMGIALLDVNPEDTLSFNRLGDKIETNYWTYQFEKTLGHAGDASLKALKRKIALLLSSRSYQGQWVYPDEKDDIYSTIRNIDTLLLVRDFAPSDSLSFAIPQAINFLKSKVDKKDLSTVYLQREAERLETIWTGKDVLNSLGNEPTALRLEEVAYLLERNPKTLTP